ncbi:hypothetical protein [Rhizobium terrae]|uniref:hypothetical protein n=1 Tax=Rhizobium terrae TaxID=2171756 RepID=UPI000E3B9F19|nr:hypothetical protein [Rhizobium terrae]
MRLHRLLILAALAAPLAACQTMTAEERRAADENTCAGYGFRRGTDAMARCMLDLELDRRADSRALQTRADRMMWPPMVVERRVIVERR